MEELLKSINDNLTCIRVRLDDLSKKLDEEKVPPLPFDDTRISDCGFSNRVLHALANAGIQTLGELRKLTNRDIKNIQNIGELSYKEICRIL